jgi:hypothetical protein
MGVDWVHLAQERDNWWAVLNMVMYLLVPKNAGNLLTEELLAFQGLLHTTYVF